MSRYINFMHKTKLSPNQIYEKLKQETGETLDVCQQNNRQYLGYCTSDTFFYEPYNTFRKYNAIKIYGDMKYENSETQISIRYEANLFNYIFFALFEAVILITLLTDITKTFIMKIQATHLSSWLFLSVLALFGFLFMWLFPKSLIKQAEVFFKKIFEET